MMKIARWGFLLFAIAVYLVMKFLLSQYYVASEGMYPGLPSGTRVFAMQRPYPDASHVEHGDVVVFLHEENGQQFHFVWRVVALPGEAVEVYGQTIAINGQPVLREHVRDEEGTTIFREQIGEASYEVAFARSPDTTPPDVSITVPPDHVFVMGDNRFNARDSRYVGPIAFSSIVGKKL